MKALEFFCFLALTVIIEFIVPVDAVLIEAKT